MMEHDNLELKAFVTNLGRYNEGELIGEWVTFPIEQDELDDVLKRIGIGEKDIFGQEYEEIFITDYDGNMPREMYDELGEYESLENLQILGRMLEKINDMDHGAEIFEALIDEAGLNYMDAAAAVINDECVLLSGVEDNYDLGKYYADEYDLSDEMLARYFDYEKLGSDARESHEAYNEDTIEEYLGMSEGSTDFQVGVEWVDMIGGISAVADKEDYMDYEQYGRDINMEGSIAFSGKNAIDYSEVSYNGESLRDEIRDELVADGILIDEDEREVKNNRSRGDER